MTSLLVVFSHGKESGPFGTKIQSLMGVAKRHGAQVLSVDYREHPEGVLHDHDLAGEAERRVKQLLSTQLPKHDRLILVGSSMGGYVSTVASEQIKPNGLFLMAPAIGLPGYVCQAPIPMAMQTCVVHGWGDDIVLPSNVMQFAERHRCELHLLDSDHALTSALPRIEQIFEKFLEAVAPSPTAHTGRAWVRQPSGKHLDLINPKPQDFDDMDLALGLARTFRWGGHSIWPRPLTVAQHSLTVLHLRLLTEDLSPRVQLLELLHDAEEGLVGFDPISPLKPILGHPFQLMMGRLQQAVLDRYGVVTWTGDEYQKHKEVDVLAAASEALHVAGWSREEIRDILGLTIQSLDRDPLTPIYGGTPWEPWSVEKSRQLFLEKLRRLLNSCSQS